MCYLFVLFWPGEAIASSSCLRYYKAKQWLRAARCFEKSAQRMGSGRNLSGLQQLRKVRLLQNASRLYARAAQTGRLAARVRWLRDALSALRIIRKEGLCSSDITQECKRETGRLYRAFHPRWRRAYRRLRRRQRRVSPRPRRRIEVVVVPAPRVNPPLVVQNPPPIRPPDRVPPRPAPLQDSPASLRLQSQPAGARVYVDGVFRGTTPLQLLLATGPKQLRLEKRCFRVWQQNVSLAPGQKTQLQPELQRTLSGRNSAEDTAKIAAMRRVGWILVGIGGGASVLAAGVHIASKIRQDYAQLQYNEAQDAANLGRPGSVVLGHYQEYKDAASQGNTLRTVGWVSMGLGVAFVAAGVIRLLTLPPPPALCQPES